MSIIVPVYNQENCIEECLNSILNQSYKKLQIIVVDDGSTDNSAHIIDEYSKDDSRIEVYHIENTGVSATRNFGISKSYGEYIQFVDADDKLRKNMTHILVKCLKKNGADMVVCNYLKKFNTGFIPNEILERPSTYKADRYLIGTLKDPGHHYYGVVWNKLYKTDIIKDNNITFDESVTLGEDFIFNINYWRHSALVTVISKYLYIYNKSGGVSLSNIKNKTMGDCISELNNRKKIFDVYKREIYSLDKSDKITKKVYQYWVTFYIRQAFELENEYTVWSREDCEQWRKIINSEHIIKKSFEVVSSRWIKMFKSKYCLKARVKKVCKAILMVN